MATGERSLRIRQVVPIHEKRDLLATTEDGGLWFGVLSILNGKGEILWKPVNLPVTSGQGHGDLASKAMAFAEVLDKKDVERLRSVLSSPKLVLLIDLVEEALASEEKGELTDV